MKAYYAHCISLYNTPQERRDVHTLNKLGFTVVQPNSPPIDEQCDALRAAGLNDQIMETVFKPLVKSADVFAFRALPDGRIPAGVLLELKWAQEAGLLIIELPSALLMRGITLEQTREYLAEAGQR